MKRPTILGWLILFFLGAMGTLAFVYHVIASYWLIPLVASLGLMALDHHRSRNQPAQRNTH